MATRNAIAQLKIDGVLTDIMLQTNAANVIVNAETGETLATRLSTIISSSETYATTSDMNTAISDAINDLINGAPSTYDTLKEISDYISAHEEVVTALNEAIGNKVAKEDGKGLSANDFTDALKTKLEGISTGANKVEASETNGNIKIDGTETVVYTHPTTSGNKHIPAGGSENQILAYASDGTAAWTDPKVYVQSGASAPDTLEANELFFKLL